MKKLVLLFALLVTLGVQVDAQKIVGYAPYYRSYDAGFDFSKYTHVHYFAIWPAADGTFIWPQSEDSLSMASQFKSIADIAQPQGVKMVITFGGTSENGSKHFAEMATNASNRSAFISRAIALCQAWGIDGIDIDWEWGLHEESEADKQGYVSLMTDLSTATNANNLSLSTDVAASSWFGQNSDVNAVDLADYINVMSYGYNGGWAQTADHHSPMSKISSIGLPYWTNQGVAKSKLNIGTAFYGFAYKGTTTRGEAFSSFTSPNYVDIVDLISAGYTVVEDNENGSYCYSTSANEIVFYDSPGNARTKMKYAKDNNYGGVIIWEIGADDDNQSLSIALDNEKEGVTAIAESDTEWVQLYAINKALIVESDKLNTSLRMYDLGGNQVLDKTALGASEKIDLSQLKTGVYIVQLLSKGQEYKTKVFVE